MAKGEAWKRWWAANREAYNERQRAWAAARRPPRRPPLSPAERAERRRETVRRWREAHPEIAEAGQAAANANKRAKALGDPGHVSAADILALWAREPACLECGVGRGVDHIVPFATGGPNAAANLQNLCRGCNARKENAARALAPEDPNFERARKNRERRHASSPLTIGPKAL